MRALLCVRRVRANERRNLPARLTRVCLHGVRRVPVQARSCPWQHDRDRIPIKAIETDREQGLPARHGAHDLWSAWFRCGSATCCSAGRRGGPGRVRRPAGHGATARAPSAGSVWLRRGRQLPRRLRARPRVHTQLDARVRTCVCLRTCHNALQWAVLQALADVSGIWPSAASRSSMYRGMPSSFHDYIDSCYPDDGPWRYCCTSTLDGGITPIATDPSPPNRCDYFSHKCRAEGHGNLYFVSLHGGIDHVAVGAPGSQCDVKQLRCVCARACVCMCV